MNIFDIESYRCNLKEITNFIKEKPLKILVTGATGLIGSCIVDTLLYINRFLSGENKIYAVSRSKEHLKKRFPYINSKDNIFFIVQDICSPIETKMDIDYIIHAASNADPHSYLSYPSETILTNILGTKNVLEYAKKNKVTKVLLTSTMEVYGVVDHDGCIKEEECGTIDFQMIRSGYPESKRVAELLCKSYLLEYQVPIQIARLGYIYGPTMLKTDDKVIAQFIRSILNRENIILKSLGKQRRSYCYVIDAVTGIFMVLFYGKEGEVYNIADKNSIITIKEIAEIAAKLGNSKIIYEVSQEEKKKKILNMENAVLNTDKIETLGWSAKYNLQQGLEQTITILRQMI